MTKTFSTVLLLLSFKSQASFLSTQTIKSFCQSLCNHNNKTIDPEFTLNDIKEDLLRLYNQNKIFQKITNQGLTSHELSIIITELIHYLRPEYIKQHSKQLKQTNIKSGFFKQREKIKDIILGTTLYLVFYSPRTRAFPKPKGLSLFHACINYYSQHTKVIEKSLIKYFLTTEARYQFFFEVIQGRLDNSVKIMRPSLTQKTS